MLDLLFDSRLIIKKAEQIRERAWGREQRWSIELEIEWRNTTRCHIAQFGVNAVLHLIWYINGTKTNFTSSSYYYN